MVTMRLLVPPAGQSESVTVYVRLQYKAFMTALTNAESR